MSMLLKSDTAYVSDIGKLFKCATADSGECVPSRTIDNGRSLHASWQLIWLLDDSREPVATKQREGRCAAVEEQCCKHDWSHDLVQ